MVATLASVRSAVRARLRVSANDPMFPDNTVNRAINIAYRNLLTCQPDGWWWQHVEEQQQNGSTDVSTVPIILTTPDNARLIRKVEHVFCSIDGNYWLPVHPRERTDQIRLAGGRRSSDGIPLSWSVIPQPSNVGGHKASIAFVFDPLLPALFFIRYVCNVFAADLAADGDTLYGLPGLLVDAVVENAVVALVRQKRNVGVVTTRRRYATELTISTQAATEWTKAARIYFNTPAAGAGTTTIRARP